MIKLLLILLIIASINLSAKKTDSLRQNFLRIALHHLNQDCYLDTIYAEVKSRSFIPRYIAWGNPDKNDCDSTYKKYDTNNVRLTVINLIGLDSNRIRFGLRPSRRVNGMDMHFKIVSFENKNQERYISISAENDISFLDTIHLVEFGIKPDSLIIAVDKKNDIYEERFKRKGVKIYSKKAINYPEKQVSRQDNEISNYDLEVFSDDFGVYPNPFNNKIFIINHKNQIYSIKIVNETGNFVLKLNNTNEFSQEINVATLSSGVYTIIIDIGEKYQYKRIIKIN